MPQWKSHRFTLIFSAALSLLLFVHRTFADGKPTLDWQVGGHSGKVVDLDIASDGTQFVSASDDGTLKRWNIADGRLLMTMTVDTGQFGGLFSMYGVNYAPDGQTVWGTSVGGGYQWGLSDGAQISTLGLMESGGRVLFSPDGQYIALAGSPVGLEDVTEVYRRSDGQLLHSFEPGGNVAAVFTADSQTLITGSEIGFQSSPGVIRYYRISDGALLHTIPAHSAGINWLEISPDGMLLASCSDDDTIKIWNAADGSFVRTLTGHSNNVYRARFSPDGSRFASTSHDGTMRFWNLQTGQQINQFTPTSGGLGAFDWSPDGATLIVSSGSQFSEPTRYLMRLDSQTGAILRQYLESQGMLTDIALSNDRTRVASVPYPGFIQCRNVNNGSLIWSKSLTPFDHRLAFTADDSRIAAGGNDGMVRFFSAANGSAQGSFAAHTGSFIDLAISPDGNSIVSHAFNDPGKIWNYPALTLRTTVPAMSMTNGAFVFAPDSATFYWGGTTAIVRSRANDGGLVQSIPGHTGNIRDVAISADGQRIVSGSQDHTLRLWNAQTGALIHNFGEHPTTVEAVGITPNGRVVASGTSYYDRRLRLWNAESGSMIAEYDIDTGAGINRIIASDNDHFLIARRDSVLMSVRIPSQELPGDIDADGDVDVDDALALAAVLVDDPIAPEHVGRSDLNGDERLDGLDVDALVPLILP